MRPQLGGQGRGLRGSLPEEGGSFWRLGGKRFRQREQQAQRPRDRNGNEEIEGQEAAREVGGCELTSRAGPGLAGPHITGQCGCHPKAERGHQRGLWWLRSEALMSGTLKLPRGAGAERGG